MVYDDEVIIDCFIYRFYDLFLCCPHTKTTSLKDILLLEIIERIFCAHRGIKVRFCFF